MAGGAVGVVPTEACVWERVSAINDKWLRGSYDKTSCSAITSVYDVIPLTAGELEISLASYKKQQFGGSMSVADLTSHAGGAICVLLCCRNLHRNGSPRCGSKPLPFG